MIIYNFTQILPIYFLYFVEVSLKAQNAIWNFRAPRAHKNLHNKNFAHYKLKTVSQPVVATWKQFLFSFAFQKLILAHVKCDCRLWIGLVIKEIHLNLNWVGFTENKTCNPTCLEKNVLFETNELRYSIKYQLMKYQYLANELLLSRMSKILC
jgi:hypothetical protein